MNTLLENGSLREMKFGSNFSYIFKENGDFATTQYKVMRNQTSAYLLPCVSTRYNGQIQLYYQTGERKPFSSIFPSLDSYGFRAAVSGIIAAAIQVKNIGFLSCENIDISFDKIYIDTATYQAALVYVPSKMTLFPDSSAFENELRSELVKLIGSATIFLTPKTMALAADLTNGKLTLEEVYQHIIKVDAPASEAADIQPENNAPIPEPEHKLGKLALRLNGSGQKFEIQINKNPFVIGKSESADGVLENKYISKKHCQISSRNGRYYLMDLGSVNKSYINRKLLQPEQDYPLEDGDEVRLANIDFKVVIR